MGPAQQLMGGPELTEPKHECNRGETSAIYGAV